MTARVEQHVCLWRRPDDDPWSWTRCALAWSDGTPCDSATVDPEREVRTTRRLVGGWEPDRRG